MKPLLFACAQSTSLDVRTKSASLFHLLEEVSSPFFPMLLPPLSVFALLQREPGDPSAVSFTLRIAIDGDVMSESPFPIDFGDKMKAKATGELQGYITPRAGKLEFALIDAGRVFASWSIVMTQVA